MRYKFLSTQKNCPAEWGPALRREPLYAMSCLSFCLLGGWLIIFSSQVDEWMTTTGRPSVSRRILLIHGYADVVQGLLSFMSDVMLVDSPSVVHLADRLLAVLLTAVGVYVEVCVLCLSALPTAYRMLMFILLAGALVHHFRAKAAISKRDYSTYVMSHTLWHFGITASLPIPVYLAIFH